MYECWQDSDEENTTGRHAVLTIEHDQDTENPMEYSDWQFISFNRNHIGYENPYDYISSVNQYGEPQPADIGIRRKLACGTAFLVSCYEHSGCSYSLRGEGMQCRWDTTDIAGILIYTGKLKYLPRDKREEYARSVLSVYTDWANGNCYWYSLEVGSNDIDGEWESESEDSCGGFIGVDHVLGEIRDSLASIEGEYELTVKGDCSWAYR